MAPSSYCVNLRGCLVALALISQDFAVTTPNLRLAAGPSYKYRGVCPAPCYQSGVASGNWSLYHNFAQIASCDEPVWYDFTLVDPVDNPNQPHRIYACTNSGPDWAIPNASSSPVAADLSTLSSQVQQYLGQGFATSNRSTLLFASAGTTSLGLYIGKNLQASVISTSAIAHLHNATLSTSLNRTTTLAMQYCEEGLTSNNIFGLIATSNSSFNAVQEALSSWSNTSCLSIPETSNFTAPIVFETPVIYASNRTASSTSNTNSTISSRLDRRGDCTTVQHVCCSAGTLPDFALKPNSDGSCATYTVVTNDNCAKLAAEYSLTSDEIEDYNKQTWAWNGCSELFVGTIICLSKGTPPMLAALSNAVCGPKKPGTKPPAAGIDISTLNPCPLNACCDCSTTTEFCTNSSTGAPRTAKPGTDGCISNCGTNIIDTSGYSHVFFSFGTLDSNYNVQVGDTESTFEFNQFLLIDGPKKVLSIGGWAFSTDPSTYMIFRNGVTAANRQTMATNIADFIKIPAASPDNGENYLAFLNTLREKMPEAELSVAAPASYWYLRGFPIKKMSNVLDYIIYITYDLHGQWDANNQWSQEGCPTGTCLRSDVNLTETIGLLVMITKAGVPSNKVIVGVTSYGRSFAMAEAGCYGPQWICTQTAGYISNAKINAIIANSSRVQENFVDSTSNSNILVYDNTQWVGYISDNIKSSRSNLYKGLAMGGVTDWASDLQKYNDPPARATSWTEFLARVKSGQDPADVGGRHGNWTKISCEDPAETDQRDLSPQTRWNELNCADAYDFSESMADTFHFPTGAECGQIGDSSQCNLQPCNHDDGTGPAGSEIWNSFMYSNFFEALNGVAGTSLTSSLQSFENTFAPVPPPKNVPEWEEILIAIVTLGASLISAPFFNSNQDNFSAYLGQVVQGWSVTTSNTLDAIFKGDNSSISILSTLIQNGNFMPGSGGVPHTTPSDETITDLENAILKGFYAFAIPSLWTAAGYAPFVMTLNEPCDSFDANTIYNYLTKEAATANACYNNELYYLVYPPDSGQRFDILPGSGGLAPDEDRTTPWGGVTVEDLILGSINSFVANGNQNGAPVADPSNSQTLSDLMNADITTPGYVRLPVCSGATAMTAYTTPNRVDKSDPNYPCVALQGIRDCNPETVGMENETSDASPLITDCQDMINNIAGTSGEWTTPLDSVRQLTSAGTCAFSVQERNVDSDGNGSYKVGSQDIVDIVNEAIKLYGSNGKVGASGTFDCNGDIKQQHLLWYLYHS
ncbi:glycoside hydrolase family 18 protein [Zasmidium cellare ATCC 36951]|uniref:chitinase n=1 Tax=Zasmidium cellare ATCC 36951 TaxID=1080233 RepID=A0A6A6BZ89_ZASCE|nr:glycoside hydrolase family 18 protein [Zasmidium cellare ATCC 36951]KAF2160117.1 glycoside hydrolase family 18 protein [Zasmidium cellare ATCC 36951]